MIYMEVNSYEPIIIKEDKKMIIKNYFLSEAVRERKIL